MVYCIIYLMLGEKRENSIPSHENMLYQICHDEGIKLEFLCTNWTRRLTKGDKVRYINGHKFDINAYAAGEIANDKCATYEVLNACEIPAVGHRLIYEFANRAPYVLGRNSLEYVVSFFDKNNQHIVIKPNCGMCGVGVNQITEERQILPILTKLFYGSPTLAMCPFYEASHEHRVILLDNEVRLTYMKTIEKASEWRFNLTCGARASAVPEGKVGRIVELARRAAKALGLRFCSVDIIESRNGEMRVLEVNCGVMTSHYLAQYPEDYSRVYNMYRDAIRKMFE